MARMKWRYICADCAVRATVAESNCDWAEFNRHRHMDIILPTTLSPIASHLHCRHTKMPLKIKRWFASGNRIPLTLPSGKTFNIFYKVLPIPTQFEAENNTWLTMVHGFPTCSYDWIPLIETLRRDSKGAKPWLLQCLVLDLLGFGDSDKPSNHTYSISEQSDVLLALWRSLGIATTRIITHDYGVTVVQELLARFRDARLGTGEDGNAPATNSVPVVSGLVFLNSGIFSDLHRPVLVQKLLLDDWIGPYMAYLITEAAFSQQMASVISPEHPLTSEELHELWIGIQNRGGVYNYHRLIKYIEDRQLNKDRWEGALQWAMETNLGQGEGTASRLGFSWGMLDPVSGAHVAEHLSKCFGEKLFIQKLTDVGHYPQLEAPNRLAVFVEQILGI